MEEEAGAQPTRLDGSVDERARQQLPLKSADDGPYEYTGFMLVKTQGCESESFNVEQGQAERQQARPAAQRDDAQSYVCNPADIEKVTLDPTDWS